MKHLSLDMIARFAKYGTVSEPFPMALSFRRGTIADYEALARFHYLSDRPATISRVLVIAASTDRLTVPPIAAVLVESRPVLSCALRDVATGGRYRGLRLRQRAMMLNEEMRCISRVIVHPQFRGLGLGERIVRRALETASTPYVEALAAMGRVHPFFERAGMMRYTRPPLRKDQRLLDALESLNIAPWELASRRRMARHLHHPFLRDELKRWAGRGTTLKEQLQQAAGKLVHEPWYYLWRGMEPPRHASGQADERG